MSFELSAQISEPLFQGIIKLVYSSRVRFSKPGKRLSRHCCDTFDVIRQPPVHKTGLFKGKRQENSVLFLIYERHAHRFVRRSISYHSRLRNSPKSLLSSPTRAVLSVPVMPILLVQHCIFPRHEICTYQLTSYLPPRRFCQSGNLDS